MKENEFMITYQLWLLGFLMFSSCHLLGQDKNQSSGQPKADTIAFQLTDHNNISIKAVLNAMDTVDLMFHTAANGVTLIEEVTKKLSPMRWKDGDEVESWGGEHQARFSENNSLQIGTFQWDGITIWENKNSGPATDGKFGPNLFNDQVMEIDFDKSILIIHQRLPEKTKAFEKLELTTENGLMFVEGVSRLGDNEYPNKFLIHSGFGGTILYDDKFADEHKIGEQIVITDEQELKDSYGNVLKTRKGKLSEFTIGKEVLKDLPVGFFEGSIGRQKISVIGGNLLKRFNIIGDSKRGFLYIRASHLKKTAY
jgi:hypothetical protein